MAESFPNLKKKTDIQAQEARVCTQFLSRVQLFVVGHRPHGLWPARLLCPWNFLGKNTGMGCHFLLRGIFPTQGLNMCVLHCRQVLYHCATCEASILHLILTKRPGNHIPVNTCAPNTAAAAAAKSLPQAVV